MSELVGYPEHWPKIHNACTDLCDMIEGPCACGAWHKLDEQWVKDYIVLYGQAKR